MKKKCQILNIKPIIGKKISYSNKKSKKVFNVNLKKKKIFSRKTKKFSKFKLSVKAINYIDKNINNLKII